MLKYCTFLGKQHSKIASISVKLTKVDRKKRQKRFSFWFSNPSLNSFPVCMLVCLFSGSCFPPRVGDCTAVVKSNGGVTADREKHSILIGACALRPSEVHSPQLREHLIAQHQ